MARKITYEQLLRNLEDLPNIKRKIAVKMDKENKKELSRRRSNFFGSRGLR